MEPLSLAADPVMRETAFASWGTLSNATAAKVTTAAKVFPGMGIKSAEITCTGANGYQPTANIPVTPGEQIFIGTLSRMQTLGAGGAAKVVLFDVTNSATFGTATSHSESTWQYMQQIETVPPLCHAINVRLQGVSATDVVDWQALWVIRQNVLRYNLPSYLDERFKVDSISQLSFTQATANSTGIVLQALSIDPQDLPKDNYDTDFPMPEANPTYVQFHTGYWRNIWQRRFGATSGPGSMFGFPLVLQMRLPYSERGTLALEADTTACPLHLIVPAAEVQLLQSCPGAVRASGKKIEQVRAEFLAATTVRANKGPAQTTPTWRMASLPN